MTALADSGAAQWVAARLRQSNEVVVTEVTFLHARVLRVTRKDLPPFNVGVISIGRVTADVVNEVSDLGHVLDFVVNIPKEAYWTGEAIECASREGAAFGGVGDLYRALREPSPDYYINPEYRFFERGLGQHKKVSSFERAADRKYIIHRNGLKDVTVVLVNAYDLTADHVRTSRDRYGDFDDLLITNPNGNASAAASSVAESLGVSIYKFGEFLGRLNR